MTVEQWLYDSLAAGHRRAPSMSPGTPRVAVDIRWLAVANKSPKGGWRPVVEVNGVKFYLAAMRDTQGTKGTK